MTKVFDIQGGDLSIGTLQAGPGIDSLGDVTEGANLSIGQVMAEDYTDYGIRARNSTLSIGGGHLVSNQAQYGVDLEHDVIANLHDTTIKGHRKADIRYGPEVTADLHNVTTRDIYDRTRRRSKICGSAAQPRDILLDSTKRQQRREARLRQVGRMASVLTGAYTTTDMLGLGL